MSDDTAADTKPLYTKGYTQYVLGVLVVVYVFNFVDRKIRDSSAVH
jgi:hypothetical protein